MTTPPLILRGVARVVDLGVQLLVLDVAFRLSPYLPGSWMTLSEDVLLGVDLTVGLLAFTAYTALSEHIGAATFGKVITGLRVGMADDPDQRPTARAAVVRSLAFYVDGLFFGLVAYSAVARSERGQRLGDEWAGTVVVWRPPDEGWRAWRGWPVGFLTALGLVVASYVVAS